MTKTSTPTPSTPPLQLASQTTSSTLIRSLARGIWVIAKYALIFLLIHTLINWWRQPVMPANPNLTVTDLQGQVWDLAQISQETPVLVYFWGSWCGVCGVTSPIVHRLAEQDTYPVVSVAIRSGDDASVSQYLNQHGYSFPTVNDEDGAMFTEWQGQVTPSYVILKQGEMSQGLTGIQPLWSLRLRLWVSSLL